MLNQCATCKYGTKLKEALPGKQESGDKVEVSRWQKATDDERVKKIKLIMPVDDAVEVIIDALPAFLCHVYVKRCQETCGIPARHRRSSAAKCIVQIDFAENYTCASDSIHKGSFVVVRVRGVKARSASNYVALVAMSSGDLTVVIYLNRSGRMFSIVDPKEWLADKVDILRVLAQIIGTDTILENLISN